MLRNSVKSSNLRSVGYDVYRQVLEVEFHSGSVYQYFNVPLGIYDGLMSASSHGRFHYHRIRDNYHYRRIQ